MKKLLPVFIFFLLICVSFPAVASAQFQDWGACVDSSGVATLRCLPVVFRNVIAAFLIFAGAVALFLIIYSGIRLVTSGGDPKQVEGARKIMTYAITGVVIVLLSFAIIYFIGYITKSKDCITNLDAINTGGC